MITLSKEQERDLIESIRKESVARVVREVISNGGMNPTLSVAQAAGYLNVTTQTLRKLPIPSYDVTGNGGSVSYRVADLEAYMEERRTK